MTPRPKTLVYFFFFSLCIILDLSFLHISFVLYIYVTPFGFLRLLVILGSRDEDILPY